MSFLHADSMPWQNIATWNLKYGRASGSGVTYNNASSSYFTNGSGARMDGRTRFIGPGNNGELFNVASGTALYVHWLAKLNFFNAADTVLEFFNSSGQLQGRLQQTVGNELSVQRGTVAVDTTVETYSDTNWHHFAMKYISHDSTGVMQVKVDDTLILDFTGDTKAQTNGDLAMVFFHGKNNFLDHFIFHDGNDTGDGFNDFLTYPWHMQFIFPDGAGNSTQWTPSAGANYQNVDELETDEDTTYNEEATTSDKDLYAMASPGDTITGDVLGLYLRNQMKRTDSGARTASGVLRTNATDYNGTAVTPADATYNDSEVRDFWGPNPNTAVAFTTGEVDAVQGGAIVRS